MQYTPDDIHELRDGEVFVFGSNTGGHHGAGAALRALDFGAQYGKGVGRYGSTYAIPTKQMPGLVTMSLEHIYYYVRRFAEYVADDPDSKFLVTKIGCGLAGYTVAEIAPLFYTAFEGVLPNNVVFPEDFHNVFERLCECQYVVPVSDVHTREPRLVTVKLWPGDLASQWLAISRIACDKARCQEGESITTHDWAILLS